MTSPHAAITNIGSEMLAPFDRPHDEFVSRAGELGFSGSQASQRYRDFYRNGAARGSDDVLAPGPHAQQHSESDGLVTTKFLLALPRRDTPSRLPLLRDNSVDLETESVVIPMRNRRGVSHTLCVSSQVGCAMGCEFCETAQMGLIRSLTPGEIVAQWFAARHHLGKSIRNIVFMGMGEPLDNTESVIRAIAILTDHMGPHLAMRRITVSTVGRLEGLARLRAQAEAPGWRRLALAVSINAPNDEIRSRIMPINRSAPLGELIPVLEAWPVRKSAKICAEYVLIPGVNDDMSHADELAHRLKNVPCCVNVIPYNPRRDSPWPAPREEDVDRFLARLESHGQFCKRRKTKGRDTMAACGQLGNEKIRGRKLVAQ
jgi:23S rRNA (adenine2503-C2)-methyltransferase